MLRSSYQYSSDTSRKEARDSQDRATGTVSTARKRTYQPRCATSVLRLQPEPEIELAWGIESNRCKE